MVQVAQSSQSKPTVSNHSTKLAVNSIPLLSAAHLSLKQQAPPYSKLTNLSANAEYFVSNTMSQVTSHQPSNPIHQTDAHQNQSSQNF
jgi:hypothetical protein